jgi:glycerol-3-phosphate dehydrogenase
VLPSSAVATGKQFRATRSTSAIGLISSRGSTIAKIVGTNILKFNTFENEIRMYVYEEEINGRKLTDIINEEHENVKYLPGHKFPPNVVSRE